MRCLSRNGYSLDGTIITDCVANILFNNDDNNGDNNDDNNDDNNGNDNHENDTDKHQQDNGRGQDVHGRSYMMYMRDVHSEMIKNQYVLFPLADASSLKVGNVMMAEYFFIEGKDSLLRAGASALLLKALPRHGPFPEGTLEMSLVCKKDIESVSGHHVWPSTFLGQKRSNLAHKLHSFIHKVRLETHSWKDTADFIKLFCCWTTDSGTEKKFRQPRVSVQSWFSWWQDTTRISGPDDAGIELDVPQAENDVCIDMTKALGIRGCMHMVNKLQEIV